MPIDPQIALQVKPVEAPDPIRAVGNALALRSHIQQQQLQQQQMQENELKLQQARRTNADQIIVRDSLAANNGDVERTLKSIQGKVGLDTYNGLVQHNLNTKKTLAEIDDKNLMVTKEKNSRFLGLVDQAMAMPADQYANLWPHIKAQAISIHPELEQSLSGDPIPQADLAHLKLGIQTSEQYLAAEAARRQKTTADALASTRNANAGRTNQNVDASTLGAASTYGDYMARRSQLPGQRPGPFPDFSGQDPNAPITAEHLAQIRAPGISAEQQNLEAGKAGKQGEEQLAFASQRMSTFARQGAASYTRAYDALPDTMKAYFTKPENFDKDRTWKEAQRAGLTSAQGVTADNAETRANNAGSRETKAERDDRIRSLADKAIEESYANGGNSLDHVIANVANPQFYQQHPIGEDRGAVLQELQHRKIYGTGGMDEQRREEALRKAREDQELTDALLGKTPAGGRGAPPAAKGGAKPVSKPAGRGATAADTAQKNSIQVKDGNGKIREYPDEAAAKRFEDAVRAAGGTTTRM